MLMMTPPGHRSGQTPPVGHPLRFTVIAHGDRSVLGPISGERLDGLVARTPLERADHMLELGCGKGDLLARLLSRWPQTTAEGFDRNPWFLAAARAAAESAGVAGRVSFIETDAPGALVADRSVAMGVAMGASGILGDPAATLAGLARAVRPGGVVLFGDGVWVREPLSSGLASFGMTRDELSDGPDGFAGLGVEAGLEVLDVEVVDEAEWDAYRGLVRRRDRALGGGEHVRPGSRGLPGTRATLPVVGTPSGGGRRSASRSRGSGCRPSLVPDGRRFPSMQVLDFAAKERFNELNRTAARSPS